MSACNRYVFTKKLKKVFATRGIEAVCKICDHPIQVGEEIESKQHPRGNLKIYHGKCYDESHMDFPD